MEGELYNNVARTDQEESLQSVIRSMNDTTAVTSEDNARDRTAWKLNSFFGGVLDQLKKITPYTIL